MVLSVSLRQTYYFTLKKWNHLFHVSLLRRRSTLTMAQKQRPFRQLMSRVLNLQPTVNESGTEATVRFSGFSADDFDRTGNLSLWRVQRMLTLARMCVYHTPNPSTGLTFLEYDKLTADKYTFMASTRTRAERSLFTLPDRERIPELLGRVRLGYIGSSSLNSVAELVDSDTGEVLVHNTNQVVTVDKTTRTPTPLPDWWRQRYADAVVNGGERLIVGPVAAPTDPSRLHLYHMKVTWSDIDAYKHTNYVAYVRFCLDATMDAAQRDFFSVLKGDILLYPTKQMDISYKGETLAGQELMVKCWENESDPLTVHYDISRDGTTVFQNTIQFFGPQDGE